MKLATTPKERIRALKRQRSMYELPSVPLEAVVPEPAEIGDVILDDICLPPYLGPDDHDDVQPLLKIVRWVQPRIVVELGTGYGNLTANVCRQSPRAVVYTVNALPDQITGIVITYKLTREQIGRVYRAHGFTDRVIQIYSDTNCVEWREHLKLASVDLAVIDGCHDFEYVINDFERIRPFVRPGGLVLFHDTHPSMANHLEGSYVACMELRRRGHNIEHLKGTWWAVWGHRRDEIMPAVVARFGIRERSREMLKAAWRHAGLRKMVGPVRRAARWLTT